MIGMPLTEETVQAENVQILSRKTAKILWRDRTLKYDPTGYHM